MRSCTLLATLLLLMPVASQAAEPCTEGPLTDLAQWIAKRGSDEAMPAYLLGASGDNVPMRQVAYRNKTTKLIHVAYADVGRGRCDIIFVLDDTLSATSWVTDHSGILKRTFSLSHGDVEHDLNQVVPNEQNAGTYEEVKRFFLEKVPPRE
jgi:hypothetical protein